MVTESSRYLLLGTSFPTFRTQDKRQTLAPKSATGRVADAMTFWHSTFNVSSLGLAKGGLSIMETLMHSKLCEAQYYGPMICLKFIMRV